MTFNVEEHFEKNLVSLEPYNNEDNGGGNDDFKKITGVTNKSIVRNMSEYKRMFSTVIQDRNNIELNFDKKTEQNTTTFSKMLSRMDKKTLNDAEQQLEQARNSYMRKRSCKWVVLTSFIFLGLVISYGIPAIMFKLQSARYNRRKLEMLMEECLGEAYITDAITDEILIVAYDYNSQEPRFYSKFYAQLDPNIYMVPIGNATGASSAAPTFFTPKLQFNNYHLKEL